MNIKLAIVTFKINLRYIYNMTTKSTISSVTLLELNCCFMTQFVKCFILFHLLAGCWIDILKISNCKWRLYWIFTSKIRIKVRKLWHSALSFLNNLTHLKTPVTKMSITYNIVSHVFTYTLYTFTNNCWTKMSYM